MWNAADNIICDYRDSERREERERDRDHERERNRERERDRERDIERRDDPRRRDERSPPMNEPKKPDIKKMPFIGMSPLKIPKVICTKSE